MAKIMYYGYMNRKPALGEITIITRPCTTKEEAEDAYENAYRSLPATLKIEFWGREHGIIKLDELIPIPNGHMGVVIKYE